MSKTAQVIITRNKVHDGLGGKYMAGETTPAIPYENAAQIVAAGFGEFVNETDVSGAEDVARTAKRRSQAEAAKTRMNIYDDLPKTIRDLAREHGNEVIERYLAGEKAYDLKRAYENGEKTV